MEQIDPKAEFEGGNSALAEGRAEDAVAHYRRALRAAPDVVEVHHNLTAALAALERSDEAVEVARRGLEKQPEFAPLQVALANLLSEAGQLDGAQTHFEAALRRENEMPSAWPGLAGVEMARGAFEKAAKLYRTSLEFAPKTPVSLNNLAICELEQGRHHEALAIYRDLALLQPGMAQVHNNLGQVLQGLGRHDEAVTAFRRALEVDPRIDNVAPFLMQSLMSQCAWDDLDRIKQQVLDETRGRLDHGLPITVQPFSLAGTDADAALRLGAARSYSDYRGEKVAGLRARLAFDHPVSDEGTLRIGYISPDFRQHSVATAFKDLIAAHARDGFTWFGYAFGGGGRDHVTAYFNEQFDHFRDLKGLPLEAAARLVHRDHLDVLVDLSGFTRHSALDLLALRPAPLQAHYLGYGATLGTDSIPYLLTDPVHSPPGLARHCSEHLVYLPDSFMATSRPESAAQTPGRASQGLPENGVVFANFNAHYKFDPETFDVWLGFLADLPGSVLWLLRGGDGAMANLRATAQARGLDPNRLVFAPKAPHGEHLARQSLADISLDCRHHTGGVSTLDALWSMVPVITLAGDNQSARTGASILHAAGLSDLVAADMTAYRELALRLATSPNDLAALKARLRACQDTAPLFDTPRLARHLEAAFREMIRRHRAGEGPGSFAAAEVL